MNGTDTFLNSIDQDYSGYAMAQSESLEMLNKALEAGSGADASGFTGGRALIPESLDNTLVNILWNQDEAVLFQRLKKQPIKSPVHQWDVRDEVGSNDGAWVPEGGNSEEADQSIARKFETAKYLQTLRKVTLQASISNMIENAMVLEQNAGTLWIIRNIETSLFYGNDDYVSEQPNGLNAQIPVTNILDARGASADSATFENMVNEGQRIIRENFGKGDIMLMSPKNMEDFQRLMRDRIRVAPSEGGMGAYVFDRYPTTFGTLELREDIFIQEGVAPSASSLTSKVPGTPTFAGGDISAGGSGSQFTAGDAGTYSYKLVALNRYGDSAATSAQTVTVAAGEEVTITVNHGTAPAPTAIKVYRQDPGGSEHLYAFTVADPGDGNTIKDTNAHLPGTSDVYILTMGQMYDAIEWFQFLPLMKFDLYPTNAAVYPFLMLLFGALALKKPVQHIRIKNVAPSSLGWY